MDLRPRYSSASQRAYRCRLFLRPSASRDELHFKSGSWKNPRVYWWNNLKWKLHCVLSRPSGMEHEVHKKINLALFVASSKSCKDVLNKLMQVNCFSIKLFLPTICFVPFVGWVGYLLHCSMPYFTNANIPNKECFPWGEDKQFVELLLWLLDERVPLVDDGSQLLKALNMLMLKILVRILIFFFSINVTICFYILNILL